MECGIVGPPFSGKSTLFNILTGAPESDYASPQRQPRRGVAHLEDPRLAALAPVFNSRKIVPATVEYVDVPGIASDEKRREPYPAQSLSELRGVEMLALVVRQFEAAEVPHPSGSIDPSRDLADATLEFIVNDLDIIERRLARVAKQHDPDSRRETELLERCREPLAGESSLRELDFSPEDDKFLRSFAFLSLKPLLVVLNLGEDATAEAELHLQKLVYGADYLKRRAGWVTVAAGIEAEISRLDQSDRQAFIEEIGFKLPTLDRIIKATFGLLGLITFFTGNEKECRAWPILSGSTALQAAGQVHDDMARGFIRAEVCRWDELSEAGSRAKLRETGKMRLEGKDYVVQDGDVVNIRFNV